MSGCIQISPHCTTPSRYTSEMSNCTGVACRHCVTHPGKFSYRAPTRCSNTSYFNITANAGALTYSSATKNNVHPTELRAPCTVAVVPYRVRMCGRLAVPIIRHTISNRKFNRCELRVVSSRAGNGSVIACGGSLRSAY